VSDDPGDEATPYQIIGGEPAVRRLVDLFYDNMDRLPEAAAVRALHPPSLQGSRDKLFWWFSGWLGGPQLYWERRGPPRLRRRHLGFAIDQAGADAWMLCMFDALDQVVEDETLRATLELRLGELAVRMVNR
jgi:hemoglobin